jgi:putative membrane protein
MDTAFPWTALPNAQRRWIGAVAVVVLLAQIKQPFPEIAPLQHIPTLVLLVAAPWLLHRWPLRGSSVAAIALFFLIHTLGGRYTYSNVPYDDWSQLIFGESMSEAFGWTRNHYDRLVHFFFGICTVPPVADWLKRHRGACHSGALAASVMFVLAISCLYEMFEWMLTLVADQSFATGYNGQQGDVWDAQKDMALAALGALICAIWLAFRPVQQREDFA